MFRPVSNQVDFPAQERDVLAFWKTSRAFEQARKNRLNSGKRWSFIDGPITANNPMGVHHAWGRTYKDLWNRYKSMQGYELRYQQGFDCQGLWVEVNVEKDLGFTSKRDIEKFGVERFINLCKERVLVNAATQTEQSIRLGYWMDWNDTDELRTLAEKIVREPQAKMVLKRGKACVEATAEQLVGLLGNELGGSYFTFSNENNYLIWTFLKECSNRGWLYRGTDSIPWCPRCGTGISQHEIDTEGYKDVEDPSITVRFRLDSSSSEGITWTDGEAATRWASSQSRYLLAWTTTPWTLPANVMAAVGPKLEYSVVSQTHRDGEVAIYILSTGTLKMLRGEYTLLGTLMGGSLQGWTYTGLFDELDAWKNANAEWSKLMPPGTGTFAHCVIAWDEVGEAEGTGIVHIAPGCGPEDHKLGKLVNSPMVAPLNEEGEYLPGFGEFTGKFAHSVPDQIENALKQKGFFYKREKYKHRYAHCWRCKSALVYRLVGEWYINMNELRLQMMAVNETINWVPAFGKEREHDWLVNMHDWMISKKRYWGLALPIWEYPDGSFEVIGSHDELKARAVEGWDEFEGHTPHRPFIDKVKIRHPKTGVLGTRVPDVGNPWLDAGIIGQSTLRYRTDPEYWAKWFPGDFMTESFPGQFRNWFYAMIAMSTVLANSRPADTILGFATLLDSKGKPMHKSDGNMIEFNEAAEKAGADMMRWVYARQRYDDNLNFGYELLDIIRKDVFIPLWNVYSFFVTYANIDGWTPNLLHDSQVGQSQLDSWILARVAETGNVVVGALDKYDARTTILALERLVDDMSNWYVRRNRERFWRAERDNDKLAAYGTLYSVLSELCKMIAPIAPFVAETIWQNLHERDAVTGHADTHFSVHHQTYPEPRALSTNEQNLLRDVAVARTTVNLGHSLRSQSNLKVRQPLKEIVVVADENARRAITKQATMIAAELNVKAVSFAPNEEDLVTYKLVPDLRKLGKRLGHHMPAVKAALAESNSVEIVRSVRAGQPIVIAGQQLEAHELIVQPQPRAGLVVEASGGIVVALNTQLDEPLIEEGLAREVIRRVNDLRKTSGFKLSDRITLDYSASPRLANAIKSFAGFIKDETLTDQMNVLDNASPDALTDAFDGEQLAIKIKKTKGERL